MPDYDGYTVGELADQLEVSRGTVNRWIREGKLTAEIIDDERLIPFEGNITVILEKFRAKWDRPFQAYVPPEIKGYTDWHNMLDELCWLVKACYSSKDDLKRKSFRLDLLLTNYIAAHEISPQKVSSTLQFDTNANRRQVTDDLKRGWYNELSYTIPIRPSTLGLSFADIEINKEASSKRFAFPSWPIIQFYYAAYFYLRFITRLKFPGFRLERHNATLSCFKSNALEPLKRTLWKFPFDIDYFPGRPVYRRDLLVTQIEHLRYGYAEYPRPPQASPLQLFENVYSVFRKRAKASPSDNSYTLFDYIRDFRTWANYLDIDNLLNLWGAGYKSFLDQNLSTLLFFIGSMAEICFIGRYGPLAYVTELQQLYELFCVSSEDISASFINTPAYQRLQIYRHLGFVHTDIQLKPISNPHAVVFSA